MDDIQPEQVSELPSPSALEQRQQLLSHHVKMVARRLSHALFVFGRRAAWGNRGPSSRPWKPRGWNQC